MRITCPECGGTGQIENLLGDYDVCTDCYEGTLEDSTPSNVFNNDRVHIMPDKCSTCIFRPGNLMTLQPGRVKGMVDECLSEPGGNIPCHKTIHGQREQQAICRGFWDAYMVDSPLGRAARHFGIVEEVEPA